MLPHVVDVAIAILVAPLDRNSDRARVRDELGRHVLGQGEPKRSDARGRSGRGGVRRRRAAARGDGRATQPTCTALPLQTRKRAPATQRRRQ